MKGIKALVAVTTAVVLLACSSPPPPPQPTGQRIEINPKLQHKEPDAKAVLVEEV